MTAQTKTQTTTKQTYEPATLDPMYAQVAELWPTMEARFKAYGDAVVRDLPERFDLEKEFYDVANIILRIRDEIGAERYAAIASHIKQHRHD